MKAVVQRVGEAQVLIDNSVYSKINEGLLLLLGVARGDDASDVSYLVDKVSNLRIFADREGKLNLSVKEISGDVLVVSQFTLLGDCKKGRRPNYVDAAEPKIAKKLYEAVVEDLKKAVLSVQTGQFGAMMQVKLVNDGPVTIILDSKKKT